MHMDLAFINANVGTYLLHTCLLSRPAVTLNNYLFVMYAKCECYGSADGIAYKVIKPIRKIWEL
jgi:hypothetical protein